MFLRRCLCGERGYVSVVSGTTRLFDVIFLCSEDITLTQTADVDVLMTYGSK